MVTLRRLAAEIDVLVKQEAGFLRDVTVRDAGHNHGFGAAVVCRRWMDLGCADRLGVPVPHRAEYCCVKSAAAALAYFYGPWRDDRKQKEKVKGHRGWYEEWRVGLSAALMTGGREDDRVARLLAWVDETVECSPDHDHERLTPPADARWAVSFGMWATGRVGRVEPPGKIRGRARLLYAASDATAQRDWPGLAESLRLLASGTLARALPFHAASWFDFDASILALWAMPDGFDPMLVPPNERWALLLPRESLGDPPAPVEEEPEGEMPDIDTAEAIAKRLVVGHSPDERERGLLLSGAELLEGDVTGDRDLAARWVWTVFTALRAGVWKEEPMVEKPLRRALSKAAVKLGIELPA